MRLMSFAATTAQMRARAKTVTRRLDSKGYWLRVLAPGTLVCAVEKGQGIPKGEQIQRIGVIEIVEVRREALFRVSPYGHWIPPRGELSARETAAEGFPELSARWNEFVDVFCEVNGIEPKPWAPSEVTRIEFRHRPELTVCCGAKAVPEVGGSGCAGGGPEPLEDVDITAEEALDYDWTCSKCGEWV